ncbi:MAG TPA: SIR2 family protein [Thermoanaerobaculia bacterium]|nr:SIR2 family protein [Thermoanaerobaculia bacterium]
MSRRAAPIPPDDLLEQMRAQKVVPFVGAGLSMAARAEGNPPGPGLPSYIRLLELLLEQAELPEKEEAALRNLLDLRDADAVADRLRRRLGEYPFYQMIRRLLEPIDREITGSFGHKLLGMLHFRRLITTNYDRLLERFVAPGHEVFTAMDLETLRLFRQDDRRGFILKLHGDITRPSTIPFGESALNRHYGLDEDGQLLAQAPTYTQEMRRYLEELFTSETVLFLGSALAPSEGYAKLLSSLVQNWNGSLLRRHYAVVPYDETQSALRRQLEKTMNIRYLEYEVDPDGTHGQLWEFMSFLNAGRDLPEPRPGRSWDRWYRVEERADFLDRQLDREREAGTIHYLTPSLTNAIATPDHLTLSCRMELEDRFGHFPGAVDRILEIMAARSANLEERLYQKDLEVRVLFLEETLRGDLDPARPAAARAVARERYRYLLRLAGETDLEVRIIPDLTADDLKLRHEATYAVIFNRAAGQPLADVTVAYATQATRPGFEIHMVHINTAEARDRAYQFERFWAAALDEPRTRRRIEELIEPSEGAPDAHA